jgi:hypothetical protein
LKAKEAREMIAQLTKITKELENEISPYNNLKPKQKAAEEEPEQETDQGMQDQGSEESKTEDEEEKEEAVAIQNTKVKAHSIRTSAEGGKRLNVYGY